MKAHLTLTLLLFPFLAFAQGNPRYLAKPIVKHDAVFCYSFYDGQYIALGYGLERKQLSIKSHNMLLRRRLWRYTTDIEYRTPNQGNRYFDLKINRMLGVDVFNYNYELRAAAGYKRIKSNYEKTTEQFFVGPQFDHNRRFHITAAYAHQQRQTPEASLQSSSGIMVAIYKDFWSTLIINASTTYWFDNWQYSIRAHQKIKHAVFIGVGLERVNDWWEADVEVGVRM